tara:strand:+ start:485 stop:1042 length:558 start_codon:yes stop_codon:yes gene_type:complete
MRIFIGIELSENANRVLEEVQTAIGPYVDRGNLTRPENFHLTLWFLGEIHGDLLTLVQHGVENVAQHLKPFNLELGNLGEFKKKNRIILWAGLSKGELYLQHVFDELVKEFKLIGLHPDTRGLNPHITLGRQLKLLDTTEALSERYPVEAVPFTVEKLTIFESKQVDGVLKYIPKSRVQLSGQRG